MAESMPFAGIATFLKSPFVPEPTTVDGEVAVIGVPYDEGTTSRAGAREGPRVLRAISANWAYRERTEPYWDGEAGVPLLGGVRFVDAGDVALAPTASADTNHTRIADHVAKVVHAGLFPVVLGGDHSVTYPVLQGVVRGREGLRDGSPIAPGRGADEAPRALSLVQFDAHMDYWEDIGGERYTHASPIIRAHEEGLIQGVTQFGIRGLHTEADNVLLAGERGVASLWCQQAKRELAERGVERLIEHISPGADVWVTFDIDCLDPAIAPGTGTPEPGGFTYYEAKDLLMAVARRVTVVGMDLVEVNPLYDPGQLAALHGARLILDLVGAVFEQRDG
jgi:agmatinase